MSDLGNYIRHVRLMRKLTQRNLAHHAGVGVPYISRIENGREQPSVAVLAGIALALGVPTADLVSRSDRCPTCGGPHRAGKL